MAFQAHVFPYGKYCSARNRKLFSGSDNYQMHNSVKHKKQSFLGVHFFRKIQETDGNCELKGLIYIFNMQLNACSVTAFYVLFAKWFLFLKKTFACFFFIFVFFFLWRIILIIQRRQLLYTQQPQEQKVRKFFPVIIFKGNFKLVESIILGIFTRLAVNNSSFDIRALNKLLIKLEFPFAHLFLALLTMETKLASLEILHR